MTRLRCMVLVMCLLSSVVAQRGCPEEGCDPRGLNCQADFQVNSTSAQIAWQVDAGNITLERMDMSVGCVGNEANIICRVGNSHSRGFVSIDGQSGSVKWYDTLMINPRQPIMNAQGDIIATDGNYMEMRRFNGSLVGKAQSFLGYINDTSSIHFVQDPQLYFFVSYKTGGIYFYDTSGMCVASTFLDEKDPVTNQTTSTWIPINQLIINTELETPCSYFLAMNNVTKKYRIYALNFNHQPPYLLEKWHLDIDPALDLSNMQSVQMMAQGDTVFCGIGNSLPSTLIITDQGDKAVIKASLDIYTRSFSSYDYPVNSDKNRRSQLDKRSIVWMSTMDVSSESHILGWDNSGDGQILYDINISQMFKLQITMITSQVMVYGFHPDDVTLVFAYTGLNWGESDKTIDYKPGNYLVAMKPPTKSGEEATVLWSKFISEDSAVIGQLVGVHDSMLVAFVAGDDSRIIGIKLG